MPPTAPPTRRRPDMDLEVATPAPEPGPMEKIQPPPAVVAGDPVLPPDDGTDNKATDGADEATDEATHAPAEERAGLRLLDLRGEALLETHRAAIARIDRQTWDEPPGDPLARSNEAGYIPGRGGPTQWLKFHGEARRTRYVLERRLRWLEAIRDGRPAPDPLPDAALELTVAADLVRLFVRGCSVLPPIRRAVSVLERQLAAVAGAAELEAARAGVSDDAVRALGPDPASAWETLAHRLTRLEDLEGRLGRWHAALDRLPSCLSRHVGAALDALGGDRAIAAGLAVAGSPAGADPLATDPVLAGLESDLATARGQVGPALATAARGGASEARLDGMRAELLGPIEARIAERRARLRSDREAAVADAVEGRLPPVAAARGGDVDAADALLKAARNHPEAFPPGASSRLEAATGEALAEAGAREFAEFLERA
jgi:hypothetical protein